MASTSALHSACHNHPLTSCAAHHKVILKQDVEDVEEDWHGASAVHHQVELVGPIGEGGLQGKSSVEGVNLANCR